VWFKAVDLFADRKRYGSSARRGDGFVQSRIYDRQYSWLCLALERECRGNAGPPTVISKPILNKTDDVRVWRPLPTTQSQLLGPRRIFGRTERKRNIAIAVPAPPASDSFSRWQSSFAFLPRINRGTPRTVETVRAKYGVRYKAALFLVSANWLVREQVRHDWDEAAQIAGTSGQDLGSAIWQYPPNVVVLSSQGKLTSPQCDFTTGKRPRTRTLTILLIFSADCGGHHQRRSLNALDSKVTDGHPTCLAYQKSRMTVQGGRRSWSQPLSTTK